MRDLLELRNGALAQPPLVEGAAKILSVNHLRRPRSGRLWIVYGLDAIENLAEIASRDLKIIVGLQIEPKLRRRAEGLGEPKRSVGGDPGLFAGDPLDTRARQTASLGETAR